jgi:hypothetical protein
MSQTRRAPSDPNSLEARYYQVGLEGKSCPRLVEYQNSQQREELENWWVLGSVEHSKTALAVQQRSTAIINSIIVRSEDKAPHGSLAAV